MKEHFKRYGWLYGVCAVLVLWPLVVWRMQRVPPLDPDTLREVARWTDVQIERRYGPSIWKEWKAFEQRWEEYSRIIGDPRFDRFTIHTRHGGGCTTTAALEPDLPALGEMYDPYFDEYDQLVEKGNFYLPTAFYVLGSKVPQTAEARSRPPAPEDLIPNYLMVQTVAKLRRAIAERAIGDRNWEDALRRLEANAHVSDPIRMRGVIGQLIAVACRAIGYGGYLTLLHRSPPSDVEREALEALVRLRETDPEWDDWVWRAELLAFLEGLSASDIGIIHFMGFFEAVAGVVETRERLDKTHLRSWAERFDQRYLTEPASRRQVFSAYARVFRQGGLKWTTVPSAVKWLQRVAVSQPEMFEPPGMPAELAGSLDRWTLALLAGMSYGANLDEVRIRSSVTVTKGRLLEAAFAARLYHQEHGEWPASMEDLVPAYIPPFVESASAEVYTLPFVPFQIAWQEVDDNLRAILWDEVLPLEALESGRSPAKALERGPIEIDRLSTSGDWLEQPVIPLALAEALQARPQLVEKAEVQMTDREVPRGGDLSRWKDLVPWKPLEADYARRVTDESDALLWSSWRFDRDETQLPPDKRGENRPQVTERTVEPPRAIRLTATLRAPERVLKIWSPGPDGEDDGGRIVYDPTNGTLSRGDMIIFPEGF